VLDRVSQSLSSEQLSEPKSVDVALTIAGAEKILLENLRLWPSTWRPSESSFERKRALVRVEICVLCGLWFSNQFEMVSVSCTLLAAVP